MDTNKRPRRGFLKWFLVFVLLAVTHSLWMPLAAKFLMVRDNIEKADAVVVLSGDWNFKREEGAVELYKEGLVGRIIRVLEKENIAFDIMKRLLGTDVTQKELYARYFESKGINGNAVILREGIATSTFDELGAAKDVVLKNHFKSVILLTSDYHMRRALMTAKWVFGSDDIKIYNATIYTKGFNPNDWWLHERSIKEVIFEYLNTGFYLVYHFMLGK